MSNPIFESINRRKFLYGIAAGTMGSIFPNCKDNKPGRKATFKNNISIQSPVAENYQQIKSLSTVAIVQSSKSDVRNLEYDDIKVMVEQAVEYAGGFDGLIHNGDVVVLKPNIMCLWIRSTGNKLDPEANGVTTDWRVTRSVVEIVRKYNPNGRVYVMESSAFQCTELAMQELKYSHEYIPGVDKFICLEDSGGYKEWDSPMLKKVTLPDGMGLYPNEMKANKSREFYLNKIYAEADVLISMPVLKNHTHTGITGALKNVGIGATPSNIYGKLMAPNVTSATAKYALKLGKPLGLNRQATINHAPLYLDMWIHDYYMCRPVDFVVTDGLHGLENGPDISGLTKAKSLEEHQMNMRMILAGRDALAADTIHALLIGMDPNKVDHLVLLSNKNVGCINPSRIQVKGIKVHEVKKQFVMTYERAARKMYSNYDPPAMEIKSAVLKDNKLDLRLALNPKKVCKVEVAVNGQLLENSIINAYDSITLDVNHLSTLKQNITIYAYDQYLNCTEQSLIM
jgi:uncharacterized protein (DUF362 family)